RCRHRTDAPESDLAGWATWRRRSRLHRPSPFRELRHEGVAGLGRVEDLVAALRTGQPKVISWAARHLRNKPRFTEIQLLFRRRLKDPRRAERSKTSEKGLILGVNGQPERLCKIIPTVEGHLLVVGEEPICDGIPESEPRLKALVAHVYEPDHGTSSSISS